MEPGHCNQVLALESSFVERIDTKTRTDTEKKSQLKNKKPQKLQWELDVRVLNYSMTKLLTQFTCTVYKINFHHRNELKYL